MINVAAVEDNPIVADSLRTWASGFSGIELIAVTSTVDELLTTASTEVNDPIDVVLLDATLRAEPDPAANERRLLDAGYRVLLIDESLTALASTLRSIALGATAWSREPAIAAEQAGYPPRPLFSEREHEVLMAYASGRTLAATARCLGISVETAKTYLKRVKAKYQMAGLPVYTKLDLAEQVRADCASGICPRQRSR